MTSAFNDKWGEIQLSHYSSCHYEKILSYQVYKPFFIFSLLREYNLGDDEKSPVDAASIIAASMEGKITKFWLLR